MWLPILTANAAAVAPLLRDIAARLHQAADAVETGDTAALTGLFADGNAARAQWQAHQGAGAAMP